MRRGWVRLGCGRVDAVFPFFIIFFSLSFFLENCWFVFGLLGSCFSAWERFLGKGRGGFVIYVMNTGVILERDFWGYPT